MSNQVLNSAKFILHYNFTCTNLQNLLKLLCKVWSHDLFLFIIFLYNNIIV